MLNSRRLNSEEKGVITGAAVETGFYDDGSNPLYLAFNRSQVIYSYQGDFTVALICERMPDDKTGIFVGVAKRNPADKRSQQHGEILALKRAFLSGVKWNS